MSQAKAVTEATFAAEVEKSALPVLVDFWAPWCNPCVRMGPVIDEVAAARAGKLEVRKVNCDDCGELAAKQDVSGIPCLVLFKGGEEVDRRIGACSAADLNTWLDAKLK